MMAISAIESIAPPLPHAGPTPTQLDQLRGTRSNELSQLVRLYCSARSLGLMRVARKLVRRAGSQLAHARHGPLPAANLDALMRCSWVERLPGIKIADSRVTPHDLLAFQNHFRYPRFYYSAERRIRYSLWHCVGWRLASLDATSMVIDVGAQAGMWGAMMRRRIGCRVFDLDLEYKPGRNGFRIGAPAGRIPLTDSSATHMVTFCAFNCFAGHDDSAMIDEAARVLKPGGQLVIVPLCIGDEYINLYDPQLIGGVERLDAGARPAGLPGWGNPFGRWYDCRAFEDRVLSHAGAFDLEIHRVTHPFFSHEGFVAMYAARLTRRT